MATTVCATRSAIVGTPSTRTPAPCGLGISTALTGGGKYDPELSGSRSCRGCSQDWPRSSRDPARPPRPRAEIDHEFEIEKFTLAELDEEEAELEKLQRWHERIRRLDIHEAPNGPAAVSALRKAEAALARYSAEVFERTQA